MSLCNHTILNNQKHKWKKIKCKDNIYTECIYSDDIEVDNSVTAGYIKSGCIETELLATNTTTTKILSTQTLICKTSEPNEFALHIHGGTRCTSFNEPPIKIEADGGCSEAKVLIPQLGFSLPTLSVSNEDVIISPEQQYGLYIIYDSTPFTTNRRVILPSSHANTYNGMSHIYIMRCCNDYFSLTVQVLNQGTIHGTTVTTSGIFGISNTDSLISKGGNSCYHSIHIVHDPKNPNVWLIQGLSVGFIRPI